MANKDEAARALSEIDSARVKATAFHRYRSAAPHFMLWGIVWLIGNSVTQFTSFQANNYIWLGLMFCAIVTSNVITKRQAARVGDGAQEIAKRRDVDRRSSMSKGLIWVFIIATAFLFGPPTYKQMNAFISLCAAFGYMAFGVWAGWRLFVVGAATAVLILVGYFFIHDYYFLWMAIVGGGALFAGGLWLRRA